MHIWARILVVRRHWCRVVGNVDGSMVVGILVSGWLIGRRKVGRRWLRRRRSGIVRCTSRLSVSVLRLGILSGRLLLTAGFVSHGGHGTLTQVHLEEIAEK